MNDVNWIVGLDVNRQGVWGCRAAQEEVEVGGDVYLSPGIVGVQTRSQETSGRELSLSRQTRNPCWGFMQPSWCLGAGVV